MAIVSTEPTADNLAKDLISSEDNESSREDDPKTAEKEEGYSV
jgi:hypothetical protein